jgi:hypothetical protein
VEQGEPADDRDQIFIFGLPGGAGAEVAPHCGACLRVQGADEVGGEVTAPAGAGLAHLLVRHVRLRWVSSWATALVATGGVGRWRAGGGALPPGAGPVTAAVLLEAGASDREVAVPGVADVGKPVAAGARCWWPGGAGPDRHVGAGAEPVLGRPPLSGVFPFTEIGEARQVMREDRRSDGNMAALVSAPVEGLTDLRVATRGHRPS